LGWGTFRLKLFRTSVMWPGVRKWFLSWTTFIPKTLSFFAMSGDRNGLLQPEFVMKKWDEKSLSHPLFLLLRYRNFKSNYWSNKHLWERKETNERIKRWRHPSEKKCKLASPKTVLSFDNEKHFRVTAKRRCAYCSTKEADFRSNIECFTCKLPFCLKDKKIVFLIIIRFLCSHFELK
jgi:hypothetical protein